MGGSSSSGMGGTGGMSSGGGGTGGGGPMLSNVTCDAPSGMAGKLKATEIASGFNKPVQITSAWGDGSRLYVVEQNGRIQLLKNGQTTEFLDITNKVVNGGERGLLGLAFHPDYVNNGRFFVHYSNQGDGHTIIEEYNRDQSDPDKGNPTAIGLVMPKLMQPYSNHNGGSIEFNPKDGFLYIGMGDGGSGGDPRNSGQDSSTLLGALLRFDVSSLPGTAPSGNLTTGKKEIYDYGLRNPYRFSFDPCTGDRYIGDVGQNAWEEIDIAAFNSGNKNWGWRVMEGTHCYNPKNNCDKSGKELPAIEYPHSQGTSVTGGAVYRGKAIPWLRGAYLYADFVSAKVWMLRWANGQVTMQPQDISDQIDLPGYGISSFGYDNDGELYLSHYNGRIYRIDSE